LGILESLSTSQREAVLHDDGPAAVFAGPGSGKTRVVTLRAARMAEQGRRLLVTTFTNDATAEMRTRLAGLLTKERLESVTVSTMHALCLQILRSSGAKFALLTDEFQRRSVAESAHAGRLEGGVGGFLSRQSYLKNTGATAARYRHDGSTEDIEFAGVWRRFEKAKTEKGLREFDDLILDVAEMFRRDEALRASAACRFTHVIVDECQDMNLPQFAVVFALGQDHKNVMLVGDPDQSLYGFRGSDRETFHAFADNPRTRVFELGENYRSTRSILRFADTLIRQDADRRALSVAPVREDGDAVTWNRYPDPDFEALAVAETILRLRSEGLAYRDVGVLYRTNAQSEAFERHFAALEIPYSIREDGDFYARKEVQGLLCYLQFFAAAHEAARCGSHASVMASRAAPVGRPATAPTEAHARSSAPHGAQLDPSYPDEWLLALLNVPNRKLPRSLGALLQNHAEIRGRRIWDILAEFHPPDLRSHQGLRRMGQELRQIDERLPRVETAGELIRIVRAATDFDGWLRRDAEDAKDDDRIQNLQRMQAAAAHYPTAGEYLAAVQRVRDEASRRKAERAKLRRERDQVTLSTGHSAKGLEWRVVFAVGWSESILPHRKAEELAEELRIAYVMATRARDLLFISTVDSWNDSAVGPSRFLSGNALPPVDAHAAGGAPRLAAEQTPEPDLGGLFLA